MPGLLVILKSNSHLKQITMVRHLFALLPLSLGLYTLWYGYNSILFHLNDKGTDYISTVIDVTGYSTPSLLFCCVSLIYIVTKTTSKLGFTLHLLGYLACLNMRLINGWHQPQAAISMTAIIICTIGLLWLSWQAK